MPTCAPADIRYPTDLSLLNEAREKTEEIIDTLYHTGLGLKRKPRTYRQNARRDYLKIAKQKKPRGKAIRKARANTEFGAKVAVSMVDGYIYVDRLSWDSFNESCDLQQAVENYRERFGFYPEAVLADKIYRSRDNRSYCKKHGIRLSGPPLGRPPRDGRPNKEFEKQDMKERNEIEGGFGVGKRRYGLARIMARLKETAESVIMLQFLVINLDRRLRSFFLPFFMHPFGRFIWS